MIVGIDIETTGLDPVSAEILEVGILAWGDSGEVLYRGEWLVRPVCPAEDWEDVPRAMHLESGLAEEVERRGQDLGVVEAQICRGLRALFEGRGLKEGTIPLFGSSVHFDRSFLQEHLPKVAAFFNHRNLDVSGVREAFRHFSPEMLEGAPRGRGLHRAIPDLEDSWELLTFIMGREMQ